MRIDLELPVLFRALPKGTRAEKHVYCTTAYRADVAEVSLSETEVTLRTERFSHEGDAFVMRSLSGRNYRKIATTMDHAASLGLFSKPFSDHDRGYTPTVDWGGAVDPLAETDSRPVAKPLADEFEWRLARDSMADDLPKSAWPASPGALADETTLARRTARGWNPLHAVRKSLDGMHQHRNRARLEDLMPKLSGINRADMENAAEMHASMAGRLLVAGGELWMESRPLCYRVQHLGGGYRNPAMRVEIDLVTAPEGYSADFYTQFFSVDDREAAFECAEATAAYWKKHITRQNNYHQTDTPLPVSVDRTAKLEYDPHGAAFYGRNAEKIRRFVCGATVECRRTLARNPHLVESRNMEAAELALLETAFADVSRSDWFEGRHADLSDYVAPLSALWKKLGHPQAIAADFAGVIGIEIDTPYVMAALEDAPISIADLEFRP